MGSRCPCFTVYGYLEVVIISLYLCIVFVIHHRQEWYRYLSSHSNQDIDCKCEFIFDERCFDGVRHFNVSNEIIKPRRFLWFR